MAADAVATAPAPRSPQLSTGGFTAGVGVGPAMVSTLSTLALLQLGPLTAPPVLVGVLVVLLIILLVGRVIVGIAWRLVLIALAVVVGLWLLGVLGTFLQVIG